MMELTEKRMVSLLWMLRNKEKKWSILELQKGTSAMLGTKDSGVYRKGTRFPISGAALAYSPTLSFVKDLEKNGFVHKDSNTREYGVSKAADLIRFMSLARPFGSLTSLSYYSATGFSATLGKIKEIAGNKLPYAFTLFSGSELYRQYVKTGNVHVYIRQEQLKEWEKALLPGKFLKAEKNNANLFLIPVARQNAIFLQSAKIKGYSVAPLPILISDLLSFGGLAEEQGSFLLDKWLNKEIN